MEAHGLQQQIVLHETHEKPLNKGEILVTRATDPGWTLLFMNAAGVVREVDGSKDKDAKVVVTIHGSGPKALREVHLRAPACEALGVKGISISLPRYGYTDMKPGRQVKDWPKEDLEPVLAQEGVDKFMITGHSQGNPHAMAVAVYFGDRCEGIGMNAPLLPADVSKEIGLEGAIGTDSLISTETLRKPYMAWYFVMYHLAVCQKGAGIYGPFVSPGWHDGSRCGQLQRKAVAARCRVDPRSDDMGTGRKALYSRGGYAAHYRRWV